MQITKGKRARAQRVVIYGPEGIGKSSLAAQFPDPLFIDTEGSTDNMDVARADKPTSWTMLMNHIAFVKANPTICQTLIIDTIDWAEDLALQYICAQHNKSGIEDFNWGSGYTYLIEEIGRLLDRLQELVELGINVVLTAHAQVKKFTKPDELGGYDRYELKLSNKKTETNVSAKVKEWADMVLFLNYKTYIITDDKTKKQKAQGGQRVMQTTHSPSWDAKNRHNLPEELPMAFAGIAHIFSTQTKAQPAPAPAQEQPTDVEQPTQMSGADQTAQSAQEQSKSLSTAFPPSLPKSLTDLMTPANVTAEELQQVAYIRGHYAMGTPIENFVPEYWDMIVANWGTTLEVITKQVRANPEMPFTVEGN
ncbi:ATP-binding protein [Streptococcus parasuis]|uniref:ATP-binding protein n=1 Tax=Streptococcus parasuis TaxID=1501662 RepID=UPI001C1FCD3E|nr:ATP-binding protein [Streptococcus parasuis]QWV87441.1 ATP-binding protein [Streptococcus parasuis]